MSNQASDAEATLASIKPFMKDKASACTNLSICTPFLVCSILSTSTTTILASRAKSRRAGPVTSIDNLEPIAKTKSEFCTMKFA